MIKILFVCHGNICRSPMAEYIMKYLVNKARKSDLFEIASCATSNEEIGNDIHYGTRNVLDKNGIPYESRKARRIIKDDFDYYDYIIAMDENNIRNLAYRFDDEELKKVTKLLSYADIDKDVADPWWTLDFNKAYEDIYLGCEKLLEYLLKQKQ